VARRICCASVRWVNSAEVCALEAHQAGLYTTAFEKLFEAYADEVRGFVNALVRDDGDDVCEEVWVSVWRALPTFRCEAAFRTWMYAIARRACRRHQRRARRLQGASLSEARTSQLVFRQPTRPSLKEARQASLDRLRDDLSPDDRALLVLRVDRGLSWDDLVVVLYPDPRPEDRARLAATLRKRFERIKQRFRDRLRAQEG